MNERERTRNRRYANRRYAGDYYYNYDQPRSQRGEEWYRHNYGLPASGRAGQRRHDVAEWANPSFTQNRSNREWKRINDNHDNFEIERRDNLQPGAHKGKGPKGFVRSDERIREDVNCRLTDDAYVDASSIDVTVDNGEVTLSGTVSDRFEKRRAEDISEFVSGVKNVENRIRVK